MRNFFYYQCKFEANRKLSTIQKNNSSVKEVKSLHATCQVSFTVSLVSNVREQRVQFGMNLNYPFQFICDFLGVSLASLTLLASIASLNNWHILQNIRTKSFFQERFHASTNLWKIQFSQKTLNGSEPPNREIGQCLGWVSNILFFIPLFISISNSMYWVKLWYINISSK